MALCRSEMVPPSVSLQHGASAQGGGDTVGSGVEEGRRGGGAWLGVLLPPSPPSLPLLLFFAFLTCAIVGALLVLPSFLSPAQFL